MMTRSTVYRWSRRRNVVLSLACLAAGLIPVFGGALSAAQAPAAASSHDIVGTWQGTLHVAKTDQHPQIDLRLVNKVTKAGDGKLKVLLYSIDQGGGEMPAAPAAGIRTLAFAALAAPARCLRALGG